MRIFGIVLISILVLGCSSQDAVPVPVPSPASQTGSPSNAEIKTQEGAPNPHALNSEVQQPVPSPATDPKPPAAQQQPKHQQAAKLSVETPAPATTVPVESAPNSVPPTENLTKPAQSQQVTTEPHVVPASVDPIFVDPIPGLDAVHPTATPTASITTNTNTETNTETESASTAHQVDPAPVPQLTEEQKKQLIDQARRQQIHNHYIKGNTAQIKNSFTEEQQKKLKQAQQERLRKAKQQYDQMIQNQRQQRIRQAQEEKQLLADAKITRSQQKQKDEARRYIQRKQRIDPSTTYTQYSFQLQEVEQFIVKIPTAQQVVFLAEIYVLNPQTNSYSRIQNIDEQYPISYQIFNERGLMAANGQFYWRECIVFEGQAGSTYAMRMRSHGDVKLITMSFKVLVEDSHTASRLESSVLSYQASRMEKLGVEVGKAFGDIGRIAMFEHLNLQVITSKLNKYYYWEIVEILLMAGVCIAQVIVAKRMLQASQGVV